MASKKGIVIYSDGGASPNPGPAGAGLHIYTYHTPEEKEHPTRVGTKWMATDCGYGVKDKFHEVEGMENAIQVVIDKIIEIAIPIGIGTNNAGEITGACEALRYVTEQADFVDECMLISDSKLVIHGVGGWVDEWKRRNWTTSSGDAVKNLELWREVDSFLNGLRTMMTVKTRWVLGHNDDYGNVLADELASIAVNRSANGNLTVVPIENDLKAFKSTDVDVHDFLSLTRVYFNTVRENNEPGLYYLTDGTDDKYISGKRTAEAVYSVVKLNEPIQVLEDIIDVACSREMATNRISYIRLDRLRSPSMERFKTAHGTYRFTPSKKNLNVDYVDKKPVSIEILPGELELRMADVLSLLEEVLMTVESSPVRNGRFTEGSRIYQVQDITDQFYTTKTVKQKKAELEVKVLWDHLKPGADKMIIKAPFQFGEETHEVTVNLLLGKDIPDRNTLKRIESLNPEVLMVAWATSDNVLQYGVVVRTDAAIGIWSNYFANLLLPLRKSK